MKTLLSISVTTFLLIVASSHCFALMMLADVSKERAKEMGVTMRSRKDGDAGVAVWIVFKTQGALKDFVGVNLRMTAGGKHLLSAPLQISRPTADSVSVHFSADPAYLADSIFMIVVSEPAKGGTGYQFKVKDFIEPEKSR
ncbi:MAG: hypothetical protein L0Z50_40230 [Verrucomicrobiales bacterium]|nr:hypothetical protein [Verrucomicrobiales bacterium]